MKHVLVKNGRFCIGLEEYETGEVVSLSDGICKKPHIQSLFSQGILEKIPEEVKEIKEIKIEEKLLDGLKPLDPKILINTLIPDKKEELKTAPAGEKLSRSGLFAKNRKWQVDKLKSMGVKRIPLHESDRVELILKSEENGSI